MGRVNKTHEPLRTAALGLDLRVRHHTRTRLRDTAVEKSFMSLKPETTGHCSAAIHQEWVQLRIRKVERRLPSNPSAPVLIMFQVIVELMRPPSKMQRIARAVLRWRQPKV